MPDMEFERLADGIYRLCVPFEEIYTSVFLLQFQAGCILLDGAASDEDAENYVLPALEKVNAQPQMIVRSHNHGDHSGGVARIAKAFPDAKIGLMEDDFPNDGRYIRLYDGDVLLDRFQVLNLRGHTDDCLALLDIKTNTLISGDCLQGGGIGKYGVSFTDVAAYLQSVERVKNLKVDRIVASHEFAPYGFFAEGIQMVNTYLNECIRTALSIK